jgi:hypothetical protein
MYNDVTKLGLVGLSAEHLNMRRRDMERMVWKYTLVNASRAIILWRRLMAFNYTVKVDYVLNALKPSGYYMYRQV